MPRVNSKISLEGWTFGSEWEFSDWDARHTMVWGFKRSPDYTIVNSNSIAAQPNIKVYPIGGEINTPPTYDIGSQGILLGNFLANWPRTTINYRSNLHCHIRVPGLKDDLCILKMLQEYIHKELPKLISRIEPIPEGLTPAAKKRERRRYVSHQTFLTPKRLAHQLDATTCQEFFEREVPATKSGKPMWHAQPRLAVGLRQLLQTDTIEFRHFPGTLDPKRLNDCLTWCQRFLWAALGGKSLARVYDELKPVLQFPTFPEFDFGLEVGYQATAAHNGLTQPEIKQNIKLILEGKFHGTDSERLAIAKANGQKPA